MRGVTVEAVVIDVMVPTLVVMVQGGAVDDTVHGAAHVGNDPGPATRIWPVELDGIVERLVGAARDEIAASSPLITTFAGSIA